MARAKAPARRRAYTPTVKAVRAELRALDERAPGVKDSAQAAIAVALAKRIDDPDTSAAAAASCARRTLEALRDLAAAVPLEDKKDGLDAITGQRDERRRRAAT